MTGLKLLRLCFLAGLIGLFTQCKLVMKFIELEEEQEAEEPKTAKEMKKLADQFYEAGAYYSASEYYARVCSLRPKSLEAHHRLARSYHLSRDYQQAEDAYQEAASMDGNHKYPLMEFYHALMIKMNGKYKYAKEKFNEYLESKAIEKYKDNEGFSKFRDLKGRVEREIKGCDLALKYREGPVQANVEHLGDKVNTAYTEISPLPRGDSALIYASLRSDTVIIKEPDKDVPRKMSLYIAHKEKDSVWNSFDTLPGPFNTKQSHTANGAYSLDRTAFYFTRCKSKVVMIEGRKKRKTICSIYRSQKENGEWQDPEKLGVNHPKYTTTQPTIGKYERGNRTYEVLYFASDRPGTRGGLDLWYAIQSFRDNDYRSARNLGRTINTEFGDEMTPHFDVETNTLYFSSNAHIGIGGHDVYKTEGFRKRWSEPENLGIHINSSADDIYYIQKDQKNGFIVSNRPGGIALKSPTCCDDIYSFRYRKILRFATKGKIYDSKDTTRKALDGAIVSLYMKNQVEEGDTANVEDILVKTDTVNQQDSLFFFSLKPKKKYQLRASKEGYLVGKKNLSTMRDTSDTLRMDISLQEIQKEKAFVVQNVYYDIDKATLKSKSKDALDSLATFLKDNPQLVVEISSHTDSIGSEKYNEKLSQRRAESVVDYLVEKGIKEERLKPKGYGETKPIAPNTNPDGTDNPEGRAKNRRTEFKIVGELEDVKLKYEKDMDVDLGEEEEKGEEQEQETP